MPLIQRNAASLRVVEDLDRKFPKKPPNLNLAPDPKELARQFAIETDLAILLTHPFRVLIE